MSGSSSTTVSTTRSSLWENIVNRSCFAHQGSRDRRVASSAAELREPSAWPVWKQESAQVRAQLGVSRHFKPWTSRGEFAGEGIPHSARVLDFLDVAASARLSDGLTLQDFYCDYSQSHGRRKWTNSRGCNPTFTTATELYAFGADRVVLPWEMLLMHGFPSNTRVPQSLRQTTLKSMVGNGMSCACVGTLLWGLHVMRHRQFEAPEMSGA